MICSQGKIYQPIHHLNSPKKCAFRHRLSRQAQSKPSQHHKTVNKLINGVLRFIIEELPVIIHQISLKYPIIPPSGYTSELKKNIKSIDVREDYKYQSIYLADRDLFILNQPQSYKGKDEQRLALIKQRSNIIKDIMKFLNYIIELPSTTLDDSHETYYQAFVRFNKNMVWITSLPEITTQRIVQEQLLDYIADPKQENLRAFKEQYFKGFLSVQQLVRKRQADILDLDNKHKFEVNNKLGKNVSIFEKDEIDQQELTFKSSALLRILTKWIEDIESTMKDSDRFIKDNGYSFKNKQNKLIQLNKKQRSIIHKQIKKRWRQLEQQRQMNQQNIEKNDPSEHKRPQQSNNEQLARDDYHFICHVLRQEWDKEIQYNFENSLKLSNQINAYVGKITLQKLIRLFRILQSIPIDAGNEYYNINYNNTSKTNRQDKNFDNNAENQIEYQRDQIKSVNLICNRLGDLLRSKIYCTQSEFIKLLQLIYQLDSYCQEKDLKTFKLIRIKDKLKSQNNNVHINYMLYEKLQCELQICFVMSNKDKKLQKNNMMNHYFYELKRGMFGVIPQLAIIINQNDPVYTLYSEAYQVFKKYSSLSQVKFYQQRTVSLQLLQSSMMKIWRCCNRYCDYFSLDDCCKFIEEGKKFICLGCYRTRQGQKWDLFEFLQKIKKYPLDKNWMPSFIEKNKQKTLKPLSRNIFVDERGGHQGVYMVIYPTNKKVFVECFLIFYCNVNETLVIRSLESQDAKAKQFKESDYVSEQQDMRKFYIKINKTNSLIGLLQAAEGIPGYLKPLLLPKKIKSTKSKAIIQLNAEFLKRGITNKQANLRLSERQGLTELEDKNIKYDLSFVELFDGDKMGLSHPTAYKFMTKLKHLSLNDNGIEGTFEIVNFQFLKKVQLRNNNITAIKIFNTPSLQYLHLSNNRIKTINYHNLQKLKTLDLQQNLVPGEPPLGQLNSLTSLNINFNQITKLCLLDSPSLTSIYCRQKRQDEKKRSAIEIKLHKGVKLKELVAYQNLITPESLISILSNPQSLKRLALEFQPSNFYLNQKKNQESQRTIFDIPSENFQNLEYFTFHANNIPLKIEGMERFINQLPQLKELQIHLSCCGIQKLDLSSRKNSLQKFTLIQFPEKKVNKQLKTENVYQLQHLTLGAIQRLNLIADPVKFKFKEEELKYLSVMDAQKVEWDGSFNPPLKLQRLDLINTSLIKPFQFDKCPNLRRIYIHDIQNMKKYNRDNAMEVPVIGLPYLRQLQLAITPIEDQEIIIGNCPQLQKINLIGSKVQYRSLEISPGSQENKSVSNLIDLMMSSINIKEYAVIKVSSKIKFISITITQIFGKFVIQKLDDSDIHLQQLTIQQSVIIKLTKTLGQQFKSIKTVKYANDLIEQEKNEYRKMEIRSSTFCKQISSFHLMFIYGFPDLPDLDIIIDSQLTILYLPFANFIDKCTIRIVLDKVDSLIIREESKIEQLNSDTQIKQEQERNDQMIANKSYKIQVQSTNKQAFVIFQVRQPLKTKLLTMIQGNSSKYCHFEDQSSNNIADSQF